VPALSNDYDSDPGRWASRCASVQLYGDVHRPVAERISRENLAPVLDVGGGGGALASLLPASWLAVVADLSPTQLAATPHPKVRAHAAALPISHGSVGAVAMLWMLYHLEEPAQAILEAKRVLRRGGLFAASTTSRHNDPELTDEYPPTPFDAEEAPDILASVFKEVAVEHWDAPMTLLADNAAVLRYCRSHLLPPEAADRVTPPVWLTKRGCLLYSYKQ
jgi:SAM-dependent methyltransferase